VNGSLRVAAVGDLHCKRSSAGSFQALFSRIAESADVLALCGDLTDRGQPDEARILAAELQAVKIPKIAVLGNHDFESDASDQVVEILASANVIVLDGSAIEIAGVGFVGVKGFAGGFGERALQAWGEGATKIFVREAVGTTGAVLLGGMTFVLLNSLLDRTLGDMASAGKNVIAFASGLVLASLLVPVKKRITDVLERIQYHDTYRARRALLDIARDFATPRPREEVVQAIVKRVLFDVGERKRLRVGYSVVVNRLVNRHVNR